ncbi:Ribosomal protein L34Ae protein [Dioscorea alata]|uniref:Ribosomal protein L34Ae protein n=1 Tax=Dioscorea alata TaxID=55571 RepID=A0ACB7U1R0_DIOAL|nr:Ribosomal protein L34Ae protein [Dioscorea alata]
MAMVDCRSLIEFCRAFEQQRNMAANSQASSGQNRHKKSKSLNPLSHPFCELSPFAAIDILILFLALGALGVLTVPYFKLICQESSYLLVAALVFIGELVYNAPIAYVAGLVIIIAVVTAWEWAGYQARKCGNPYCKGLKKAIEFDIQLESEECVKYLPPLPEDVFGARRLELGQDHKELEAELKKMAPLNGRTVLIFRSRCGCPAGRMEVWGPKKVRRIKK